MDSYIVDALVAVISMAAIFLTRNYILELRETRKDIKKLRTALKRRAVKYRIMKRKTRSIHIRRLTHDT